ncbi:MAG TPA: circadian clock protein KaiC, partial [Vicinamibacteria bacterium]|nr:circadian clock protein KaiC [Vicinamibacteria bacterium]
MSSGIGKLQTGVPGLDVISHGGLPEGRSTLVVGKSGTGKTVLGLQIAANFARNGVPVILLAVEESPDDLSVTGDALGLGISDLVRDRRIRISDATRPMDGPMIVSGEYDISGLVHRVEAMVKEVGARAIVLDSATALFSPRPPQELLRSLFFQLIHAFRKLGITSIVLAEAGGDASQLTTLGVEDYVCDVVLIMRNVVDGDRRRRTVEINKYRRSAHYKGEYPCTITSRGLAVFPLDATEPAEHAQNERYSSGFPGLDRMIQGGLLRDSIAIVRGPTGSGKTMLAGLYARAGALRGERVVYYGFEEPRAILLRNFAQIGMPMGELEEAGFLRLVCRYPEATSLEDLLVDLRNGMEQFGPSLVVMDSISSIEHASSPKGFRQFMIGVAAILRQHGRSALLTQTVGSGQVDEHAAPFLSTIADMILTLDYSVREYELKRTLRVIKMRGSAHETHPYRLDIGQGGLDVERIALREIGEFRRREGVVRSRPLDGIRILWVEDFEDARETVAILLRDAGATVTTAGSASEARSSWKDGAFDLLLSDVSLPDEDGYELLRSLRR